MTTNTDLAKAQARQESEKKKVADIIKFAGKPRKKTRRITQGDVDAAVVAALDAAARRLVHEAKLTPQWAIPLQNAACWVRSTVIKDSLTTGTQAAIEQAAAPEGWKLVPINPTEKMLRAWLGEPVKTPAHEVDEYNEIRDLAYSYRALLAAAPSTPPRAAKSSDHLAACAGGRVTQPLTDVERDANRYRWLRQGHSMTFRCGKLTIITGANPEYIRQYPAALDAAVDAYIAPRNDAPTSQINPGSVPREGGHE